MAFVLQLHNIWRWVLLVAAIVVVIRALVGWLGSRHLGEHTARRDRLQRAVHHIDSCGVITFDEFCRIIDLAGMSDPLGELRTPSDIWEYLRQNGGVVTQGSMEISSVFQTGDSISVGKSVVTPGSTEILGASDRDIMRSNYLEGIRQETEWLKSHKQYSKLDDQLGMAFVTIVDIQVFLGLIIWLFGPLGLQNLSQAMGNAALRFIVLEHPILMLIALAFAHIGRARSKKAADDTAKHRISFVFYLLSFIFIALIFLMPMMMG